MGREMTRKELEQAILELVDIADEVTRSDLQGIAQGIAIKAISE